MLIQLNESFLTYAKTQGLVYLNNKLVGMSVSDVSGSKGIFHYSLSSMHINSFEAPKNQASVTTAPPNGINFNVHSSSFSFFLNRIFMKMASVHAALHGNYHIKVGSGWLSVSKSGTFDISATASASVTTQVTVMKTFH